MQIARCGTCHNCQRIEKAKTSVLRCANPPFSHADDNAALVWNQTLLDNPCEAWTKEQKLASQAGLLTVSNSIRPVPDTLHIRLTVDVIYRRRGELPSQLQACLEKIARDAFGDGKPVGDTKAEVDDWLFELDTVDPAIESAAALADVLDIDAGDLDGLMHDVVAERTSRINNQELDEQVKFLCEQLGAKRVIVELNEIADNREPE